MPTGSAHSCGENEATLVCVRSSDEATSKVVLEEATQESAKAFCRLVDGALFYAANLHKPFARTTRKIVGAPSSALG